MQLTAADNREQLLAFLDQEQALLEDLLVLMDQEQQSVLDSAGAQPLEQVLERKQALLAELEEATSARLEWLSARKIGADSDSLLDFTAMLDGEGKLPARYREFESVARACQSRNQLLGQLNRRRRQSLARAADALGITASEPSPGYSSFGISNTAVDARLLGSA